MRAAETFSKKIYTTRGAKKLNNSRFKTCGHCKVNRNHHQPSPKHKVSVTDIVTIHRPEQNSSPKKRRLPHQSRLAVHGNTVFPHGVLRAAVGGAAHVPVPQGGAVHPPLTPRAALIQGPREHRLCDRRPADVAWWCSDVTGCTVHSGGHGDIIGMWGQSDAKFIRSLL